MKKLFLLTLLMAGVMMGVEAQNRSIGFEQTREWKKVIKKAKKEKKLIFVDCYTSWCGPCKMLSPVIDEIAKEYEGKAKICRVNVDEEMELAQQYRVMSVPTVLVFKNGQVSGTSIGYVGKEKLTEML